MSQLADTEKKKHERLVGFERVVKPISSNLEALNHFFDEQIETFEPEVRELAEYAFAHKGKRIRPILTFYSGWAGIEDEVIGANLVKAAAVVELVHLATLVHDDILDEAMIRHSTPTVNRQFGVKQAVLLGDALFAHALYIASDFPTNEVCRAVSRSTRCVCSGEIKQTLDISGSHFSINDYFRIIDLKTAELFYVSCIIGAKLAGAGEAFQQAVGCFGRCIGRAYQIFDDLADIVGSEQKIGKTLGTDLVTGKWTLPMILLFSKLEESSREQFVDFIRDSEDGLSQLKKLIHEYGIFGEVLTVFNKEMALARAALDPFKDEPACSHLIDFQEIVASLMDSLEF